MGVFVVLEMLFLGFFGFFFLHLIKMRLKRIERFSHKGYRKQTGNSVPHCDENGGEFYENESIQQKGDYRDPEQCYGENRAYRVGEQEKPGVFK